MQCEKICKASQAFRTRTPPRQFQIWSHACRVVHRSNEATTHTLTTPHTRARLLFTQNHTQKSTTPDDCVRYIYARRHTETTALFTQAKHKLLTKSRSTREREKEGERTEETNLPPWPSPRPFNAISVACPSPRCVSALFLGKLRPLNQLRHLIDNCETLNGEAALCRNGCFVAEWRR